MQLKPWFILLSSIIFPGMILAQEVVSDYHLRSSSNKDFESELYNAQKKSVNPQANEVRQIKETPQAARRTLKLQIPEEDLFPPAPDSLTTEPAKAYRSDSAAAAADHASTQSSARLGSASNAAVRPIYPMPKNERILPQMPPPVYHSYPPPTHSGFIMEKRETDSSVTYTAFPARAREAQPEYPLNIPVYTPVLIPPQSANPPAR